MFFPRSDDGKTCARCLPPVLSQSRLLLDSHQIANRVRRRRMILGSITNPARASSRIARACHLRQNDTGRAQDMNSNILVRMTVLNGRIFFERNSANVRRRCGGIFSRAVDRQIAITGRAPCARCDALFFSAFSSIEKQSSDSFRATGTAAMMVSGPCAMRMVPSLRRQLAARQFPLFGRFLLLRRMVRNESAESLRSRSPKSFAEGRSGASRGSILKGRRHHYDSLRIAIQSRRSSRPVQQRVALAMPTAASDWARDHAPRRQTVRAPGPPPAGTRPAVAGMRRSRRQAATGEGLPLPPKRRTNCRSTSLIAFRFGKEDGRCVDVYAIGLLVSTQSRNCRGPRRTHAGADGSEIRSTRSHRACRGR